MAFVTDVELAVGEPGVEAVGGEGADEDEAFGGLGNVDEAAGAGDAAAVAADVDVAVAIAFGHGEEGDVESAAIVEIEHGGLVDDGHGEAGGAEAEGAGGDSADDAGFDGEDDAVEELPLPGDAGDAFGDADAEVDDVAVAEFVGAAGGDPAAGAGLEDAEIDGVERALADEIGIELAIEGLGVQMGRGDDDGIDEDAGEADIFGIAGVIGDGAFDLSDDDAAVAFGGLGHGEDFTDQGFVLHGDIAVGIGRGAADEGHMDGEGLVEQHLVAFDFDEADEVFGGDGVDASAAMAGVDEGTESDFGEHSGISGGNFAE